MAETGARERIRRAALELFARKGIAGATVNEIARRARCSQAALYKHWDGKDPLAHELFTEAHAELVDTMKAEANRWRDPVPRIAGALAGLLDYSRRRPEEFGLLFQVFHTDYAKWLTRLEKPSDVVLEEVKAAVASGAVPAGDPALKAGMLLGMAIRVALFERQNLIRGDGAAIRAGVAEAAAAVLGV